MAEKLHKIEKSVKKLNLKDSTYVMDYPAAVLPYKLPQKDDVEEGFDPTSYFAISESGKHGPLTEINLKKLLRGKLDKKIICTIDVVELYTTNIDGLYIQLSNFSNRIHQINTCEMDRSNHLKRRLKQLEKALTENRRVQIDVPFKLHLSNSAEEAYQYVGSLGPLKKEDLIKLTSNGSCETQASTQEITGQLKYLLLRIDDNLDMERNKYTRICESILKAINDNMEDILKIRKYE